jgi:hypothetical protein
VVTGAAGVDGTSGIFAPLPGDDIELPIAFLAITLAKTLDPLPRL